MCSKHVNKADNKLVIHGLRMMRCDGRSGAALLVMKAYEVDCVRFW